MFFTCMINFHPFKQYIWNYVFFFSSHQVSRFSEEDCYLPTQTGCKYSISLRACCMFAVFHSLLLLTEFVKWLLINHLFHLSQVQLPDKIVIYELNTDDISDMHYKVKVTWTLSEHYFITTCRAVGVATGDPNFLY